MSTENAAVGPIERFMVEDHVELDRLLAAATASEVIDDEIFATFRERLLRHIAMEEIGPPEIENTTPAKRSARRDER